MYKKYLLGIGTFCLAIAILLISVFRTATVHFAYATPVPSQTSVVLGAKTSEVDYNLPFPGTILPDSPFWDIKALRDKLWLSLTANPMKRAELALLFADKRLAMSEMLFQSGKQDAAISTLTKGEKYLEIAVNEETIARIRGMDTGSFLYKMTLASLKHRQVIEDVLMPQVSDGAKAYMAKVEDYSKDAYKSGRDALNAKSLELPESPFSGD